jgi:hypothetical protein
MRGRGGGGAIEAKRREEEARWEEEEVSRFSYCVTIVSHNRGPFKFATSFKIISFKTVVYNLELKNISKF